MKRPLTRAEAAELHVMQHSLGLDQYGRDWRGNAVDIRDTHRNHFATGRGSKDFAICESLVEMGFMTVRHNVEGMGGMSLFHVTDAGREAVVKFSPEPPRVSRSAARYERFLRADSDLTFGEWMRRDCQ